MWFPNSGAFNSGGSAALTMATGAKVNFAFSGTGVSWIGYRDEWSGIANVYVDGALKATVDTYASPGKAQAAVYSVSGLAAGNHTLTIAITGTKNASSASAWVWIDAFDVATGATTPATPPPTDVVSNPQPATPSCAASPIRVEQNAPAVTYSGTWFPNTGAFNSGGSAVLAGSPGSKVTFSFTGCSASWITYRDQWSGSANIWVDGVLKGAVDGFASPHQEQFPIYTITDLPYGPHTMTIEPTGFKNAESGATWVWIDAFEYQ
jgi:hypothetical protein